MCRGCKFCTPWLNCCVCIQQFSIYTHRFHDSNMPIRCIVRRPSCTRPCFEPTSRSIFITRMYRISIQYNSKYRLECVWEELLHPDQEDSRVALQRVCRRVFLVPRPSGPHQLASHRRYRRQFVRFGAQFGCAHPTGLST